jgi:hypothetical protein
MLGPDAIAVNGTMLLADAGLITTAAVAAACATSSPRFEADSLSVKSALVLSSGSRKSDQYPTPRPRSPTLTCVNQEIPRHVSYTTSFSKVRQHIEVIHPLQSRNAQRVKAYQVRSPGTLLVQRSLLMLPCTNGCKFVACNDQNRLPADLK